MLDINDIGHSIQLAVAPVFLITGIASLLGVLTTRFGRITDRARLLERHYNLRQDTAEGELLRQSLRTMWKRSRLINRAVAQCACSALLICLVVILLFVAGLVPIDISSATSIIFILAMLLLIFGLVDFFREIHMATDSLKQGLTVTDDSIASIDRVFARKK